VAEREPANPVSATAYWTLAARYADATGPRPIANDTYAERFMDDTARAVADRFRSLTRPAATFPVRHRIIDDLLRAELDRDPNLRVVVVGCGFDTRAFRLAGGRWLEFDEPELIVTKEARLPASEAPNELVRVPSASGRSRSRPRSRRTRRPTPPQSSSRASSGTCRTTRGGRSS